MELSSDMRTLIASNEPSIPSTDLLQKAKKPRSISEDKTFKIAETKSVDTTPISSDKTTLIPAYAATPTVADPIKLKEKEDLEDILNRLEKVRLNLSSSGDQGYLYNASATIAIFIRNNYNS